MLSDLLDKRKSVQTENDLERLAAEFGVEPDRLKRLARFVNSPSIDSSTIQPASGKSEEEGFIATVICHSLIVAAGLLDHAILQAVWVEPKVSC